MCRVNLVKAKEQPANSNLASPSPSLQAVPATDVEPPESTANGAGESSMQLNKPPPEQGAEKAQAPEIGNGHSRGQNGASTGLHCLSASHGIDISPYILKRPSHSTRASFQASVF